MPSNNRYNTLVLQVQNIVAIQFSRGSGATRTSLHAMAEYSVPWAPTSVHFRLPAVRAYVEGERLCDANETEAGLKLLREAIALAWELDQPDWPGWADCLYHQVTHGLVPNGAPPPPLLAADTATVQPALAPLVAGGGSWWSGGDALAAIADTLRSRNHVVVDGFLGREGGLALRATIAAAWDDGLLQPAKVAQPGNGLNGQRSDRTRSDHIAWVDHAAEGCGERWSSLAALVTNADTLVHALLRTAPDLGSSAPAGTAQALSRMRPMVSRYGAGASFARHADNHCGADRRGPHCNGRWLTAVYYANDGWAEADGGCLRLYRPQGEEPSGDGETGAADAEAEAAAAALAGDAIADVAPLLDRLLLFFSDFRSPHEVLPAAAPRFATTLWYMERDAGSVSVDSGGALNDP